MEREGAALGRPRSERSRQAILHAADDLLVELGYGAVTMKGIAERAGVGRQTVHRWWASKAEVLLEASLDDAQEELAVDTAGSPEVVLGRFLDALVAFLTSSAAGTAYRALVGEAQHDRGVAALIAGRDVVARRARAVVETASGTDLSGAEADRLVAELVGPVVYWLLIGGDAVALDLSAIAGRVAARLPAAGA